MDKITMEDLYEERFIENLIASPKRTNACFTVAKANEAANAYDRDIYIYRDHEVSPLTFDRQSTLLGYDDETHILILKKDRQKEGFTNMDRLSVTGGEAEPYLSLPLPVSAIQKVTDTLYVLTATINRYDADAYLNDEKNSPVSNQKDYEVIEEIPYCANGVGYTSGSRTALFTLTIKKGIPTLKRITSPTFHVQQFIVHDKEVYYIGNAFSSRATVFNKLFVYHTNTKKNEGLYTKADLNLSNPFLLGNDLYLFSTNLKEYGINETPAFSAYKNGVIETLEKPEVQLVNTVLTDISLGAGKQAVTYNDAYYTLATVEDHTELWKYDTNLQKSVLFTGPGALFFFEILEDEILFARATKNSLCELYAMSLEGKKPRRITKFNQAALADKYIAEPKRITYQSEGNTLHGWVLLPENYEKRKSVPGILEIHGGPRVAYGELYSHEMQTLVAKGYAVFFTNIKGSDGRGDAFADIRGDYGGEDYRNLMEFTDVVLQTYPKIDSKRIGVTGGSYGGFMTNWIIGHTKRFVCAVSQRSISNWLTFSLLSDIGIIFGPDQCGAENIYAPLDLTQLWEHSPLKYSSDIQTPTLFLHSDADYRCPLDQGMQLMQAMAQRNVETKMVVFHGENHELSRSGKPHNRIQRLKEMIRWFDAYTGIKRNAK